MKRILTLGLALLMLMLAGCSTEVTEYRQQHRRQEGEEDPADKGGDDTSARLC